VTTTLISKFRLYHQTKLDELPEAAHDRFESRLLRALLVRYMRQFFAGMNATLMSMDDVMRFIDDETKVGWAPLSAPHNY
jgi:hypothetical protein